MEFVREADVFGLLREHGVVPAPCDTERVYLRMDGGEEIVRVHMTAAGAKVEPAEGARLVTVAAENIPRTIERVIQKLRLRELLLVPVGKWRHLFDAVAFSLAENEEWQAFDTTATVELNSRDPLLCEPADFHTVTALIRALLEDAEDPKQGLMVTTTVVPLLVEIIPDGAARMNFGNEVLADEVAEALAG